MLKRSSGGKKSRKNRRQLRIGAVALSALLSGFFIGGALNARLVASEAQRTTISEEGLMEFQDYLSRLSCHSVWLGLSFLVITGLLIPGARSVIKRYFAHKSYFKPPQAATSLICIFLVGFISGFFSGALVDHVLTMLHRS